MDYFSRAQIKKATLASWKLVTESRLMGQRETKRKTVTGSLDTENCSYIEFVLINMLQASATNHLTPLIEGDGIILQEVLVCENHEVSALFGKCITELFRELKVKLNVEKRAH